MSLFFTSSEEAERIRRKTMFRKANKHLGLALHWIEKLQESYSQQNVKEKVE